MENIEKVLDRGEKIELLVDKTATLNQQVSSDPCDDMMLISTVVVQVQAAEHSTEAIYVVEECQVVDFAHCHHFGMLVTWLVNECCVVC